MKKYRPSNSTEGDHFTAGFCSHCRHENGQNFRCTILDRAFMFDTNHPQYPDEWTYDRNGLPTCTKYSFWDWATGDPPEVAEPDPNQLNMFGD